MCDTGIQSFRNSLFDIACENDRVTGIRHPGDLRQTQFILEGANFGNILLTYRKPGEQWTSIDTGKTAEAGDTDRETSSSGNGCTVRLLSGTPGISDLLTTIQFSLKEDFLEYDIRIDNLSDKAIEIGDLAIPFPMNSSFKWGQKAGDSVLRHSFISGHGSYLFWVRCDGYGPYMVLTPRGNTKFEYYDMYGGDKEGTLQYRAYIHSAAQGEVARHKGCSWRQNNTNTVLAQKGSPDASIGYSFKIRWAEDYNEVRRIIAEEGLIDVQVVPGMTVPENLHAMFSLKTNEEITSVEPEFPDLTDLEYIGMTQGARIYKVRFRKLGENLITIKYGNGKYTVLEFFSAEPLETLIKKRAAFIKRCQHRDTEKWYNGLFAEWNMETQVLLGPDNYDRIKGWRIYEVSCDDPGLCKPAFLAAKNAEFPVQEEVEALDYYIDNFVWGGLQRTDSEEYSYGIYGIPDWKTNRSSENEGPRGRLHIWRIYDYPHIMLLYWSMYLVARDYPHIKVYLQKEQYLERAYRTVLAMFTIPVELDDWSAYKTGLYNELVIEDIINELFAAGMREWAIRLKNHWEKKVRYFVNENSDIFGSEYPFDSTGFESTHAFAGYALQHSAETPDEKTERKHQLIYADASAFMEMQTRCNIACRGWLEPAYYLLGSDYRGCGNAIYTLSYMSQMGGWSILDYSLNYSQNPYELLRLGYASVLSSWALLNSGSRESNYGYWYPGEENDGGAGGGFEPSPFGHTWLGQEHHRGSWYYSCEIDLGYCGALRAAATVLADDPLFGLFCFGGDYVRKGQDIFVTMKDGVRRRLHLLYKDCRIHIVLDRGHISAERPVYVKEDLSEICFYIETTEPAGAVVNMKLGGLPEGPYIIRMGAHLIEADGYTGEKTINVKVEHPGMNISITRQSPINQK